MNLKIPFDKNIFHFILLYFRILFIIFKNSYFNSNLFKDFCTILFNLDVKISHGLKIFLKSN